MVGDYSYEDFYRDIDARSRRIFSRELQDILSKKNYKNTEEIIKEVEVRLVETTINDDKDCRKYDYGISFEEQYRLRKEAFRRKQRDTLKE
jgi:hypothetical protein